MIFISTFFSKISISIISEVVLYEYYLIYEGLLNRQLLHHDHYMLCFIESYTIRVDAKTGSCQNLNLLHVLVSSVIMLLRSFDLITSNNLWKCSLSVLHLNLPLSQSPFYFDRLVTIEFQFIRYSLFKFYDQPPLNQ